MLTKTNKKLKKIIASYLVLSLIFLTTPMPVRAEAWGTNMAAAIWKQMTEEMVRKIREMQVAQAKIMAIKQVQQKTQNLISGGGATGGKKLIYEDWNKEVWQTAQKEGETEVKDYFKTVKQRTGQEGKKIVNFAEKSIQPTYYDYSPNIDKYLQGKKSSNPKLFWAYWTAKTFLQNQSFLYAIGGLNVFGKQYSQVANEQLAKGVAYGGYKPVTKGTTSNGIKNALSKSSISTRSKEKEKIVLPGSTVRDLNSKVHGMGIDTISMARSLPEIITALVVSMLNKLLKQGLGMTGQFNGGLGKDKGKGNIFGKLGGLLGINSGIGSVGGISKQPNFGLGSGMGMGEFTTGMPGSDIFGQLFNFIQGGGRSAKYFTPTFRP